MLSLPLIYFHYISWKWVEFNFFLPPGLHEKICNVIPKDLYIETGSSAEIMCLSHCVPGKIFWTLNSRVLDESSSKTINSSHTVLLLEDITNHIATVQCHSSDTQQVLGGTTITTYSKKFLVYLEHDDMVVDACKKDPSHWWLFSTAKPSKLSCVLHYENQAAEGLPELFTCNWKHQIKSLLKINYTVLWWVLYFHSFMRTIFVFAYIIKIFFLSVCRAVPRLNSVHHMKLHAHPATMI